MDILVPDIAVTEKVVRSVGVYLFLLIAFRLAGSSAPSSSWRSTGRRASRR